MSDTTATPAAVLAGQSDPVRSSAILFDVSDRTQFEVTGSDRARFLHGFTTNDIKRLTAGQGCEAFITNIKGKVVGHLFIFCDQNALWLDGTPLQEAAINSHLGKFLLVADVQLIPRTTDRGEFYLSGDRAAEVLGLKQEMPVANQLHCSINRIPVDVRRVDILAAPGFMISVPRAELDSVSNSLIASGAVKGSAQLFEAMRIEAGFPVYGVDITDENLAQEVARNRQCISFNKGCYLGQEPIARIDSMGHTNQELRRLRFEANPVRGQETHAQQDRGQETHAQCAQQETQFVPQPGTAVFDESGTNQVGVITSASLAMGDTHGWSNSVNAIALMKRVALSTGTRVQLRTDQTPVIGTVL